jgi:hypothetical protein
MKALLIAVGLAVLVSVDAGGYIAKGGVIDFKKPLDYYESAVQAGELTNQLLSLRVQNRTFSGQS